MKLLNATTCQIRHHHQVRRAANSDDAAGNGGGVGRPVAACSSALAIPDDPLDGIVQSFGAENNGFTVDTAGTWFDEFFEGGMDVGMSTYAGAEEFMEMMMDLPVPDATVLASEATETATLTRAEAGSVPDRPAVPKPSRMSVSSSDGMDDDDDDQYWVSSSDSSSDDDVADAHWLPSKSKKRSGTKRRLQQQSTPAGQRKQQAASVVLPAPNATVVAAEGGGGGVHRWCRHCGTVETPLWRAGPDGAKTLCNACGLRYKNKTAAPTTMRRPTAKLGGRGEGKNQTVLRSVGDTTVVRKKRSIAIRSA